MARRKFKIFRIGGWILIAITSLILITTLVFYIRRDHIADRLVGYLNEQQPGEVQLGKMYLIPFINFPNVTLHLREVKYYERGPAADEEIPEPILSLRQIYVTLDLIKLMRGGIMVSEARLEDGFVHMVIYPDSLSNVERALGISFGAPAEKDPNVDAPELAIDLDKIELVNVRVRMDNQVNDEYVDLAVNRVESSFSYLEGQIRSALEVDIYINTVKYQTVNAKIDKIIALKGSIVLDRELQVLEVEPSNLSVSGLTFETWGKVELRNTPRIYLAFSASNEGLELLNFLFLGILDLNEIEQIGGGSIHLSGAVHGYMGSGMLPVVRVNGEARDLGFRIRSVERDVTGISFQLFATNGGKSDLSEGLLEVRDFRAQFPEGDIHANITASNIKSPELNIEVKCAVDLEGLEEMFNSNMIKNLKGSVDLQGQLSGHVDRNYGSFLDDDGSLTARLDEVSFLMKRDSLQVDSIGPVSGEFILHDTVIEARELSLAYNGSQFKVGISTENLLLYLLDYNRNVSAAIAIESEGFDPARLLQDTSIGHLIGGEIEDFYLHAGAKISKKELDNFLDYDAVPEIEFTLDSFGIALPMFATLSNVSAAATFSADTISLHRFKGKIGDSSMAFSGKISNYDALSHPDSGGNVTLDFSMGSALLWAEDLFTFNGKFLLPEEYISEYLEDFRMTGRMEAPAAGLVYDSIPLDFGMDISDLGWSFRYYPSRFKNFVIQIRRMGNNLLIENVQGSIGENNMALSASIENFADSLMGNISGSIELYSDLLDFNHLLSYQVPEDRMGQPDTDSVAVPGPPGLSGIEFPNIDFTVNIGELRYGKHTIYGMDGRLRTSKQKVLYLDEFVTSPEGRGSLELNGQLNLTNPEQYVLSAEVNLAGIDINDLNLELQLGDSVLAVKDHFYGIVDGRGLAEIFITPELKVDMPSSVAQFALRVSDGALINFTPLQAAGKFLDNKDLNNVRFDMVRNSFTFMDSRIVLPMMNVESTLGQLLITGEQGLDGSYLYLVRVPQKLAREAAKSAMSEGSKGEGEDEVVQMKRGNFIGITLWSNGKESEFKLGDRRNKYKK